MVQSPNAVSDLVGGAARILAAVALLWMMGSTASAADLKTYLPKITPADFFPGADRFGPSQGDPPIAPVYRGDQLQGFVYLNSDFANATGYSGKPIHILVGIDPNGIVKGVKLIDHHEPIVLIGIPEPRIVAAVNSLIGKGMKPVAQGAQNPPQVDIVSGATVTVLVMSDSIVRSAVRLIRTGRIGGGQAVTAAAAIPPVTKTLDLEHSEIRDWAALMGDGSVRRLHLTVGDVNDAFTKAGNTAAAQNPESGNAGDTLIDLYVALVTAPTIGRSLLGDDGYQRLKDSLKPGQQAIVVAGNGAYSFKGSAYVHYTKLTDGLFDVTVQPLWELYAGHFSREGADPAGPAPAAIEAALGRVGWRRLSVARDLILMPHDMAVTLNGIAQGSVTDKVVDLLRGQGIGHSLVDMGEARAIGSRPDGRPWEVGIADPDVARRTEAVILLVDRAVSTSGSYGFRFDQAGRFNHLFDPRTGGCASGYRSVTTVSRSATAADALSTAFSLMPEERIRSLLPYVDIERVHLIDAAGRPADLVA